MRSPQQAHHVDLGKYVCSRYALLDTLYLSEILRPE